MATTDSLVAYYQSLLIRQFATKAKARAHVAAVITPTLMDQMPLAVQSGFTLATAVGVQLDTLGKYIGVTRNTYNSNGPIVLNDSDYRILLRIVLIKNTSDSSLYTIQTLLASQFPNQISIADNQTMQLNYVVASTLGSSDLLSALVYGNFLPKPLGVQVAVTIVPALNTPFYGWRTYSNQPPNVTPMNAYAFYHTNYPWLSYSGVVNV